MEPDRQEVYERIPWETLENKGNDRQWLVYAVAGAVVLGALAYSFMRNQPTAPPAPAATATTMAMSPATTIAASAASPTTIAAPVVVAESDLYAVDPELVAERATGHAEWFAVEYLSYDGTEASREIMSNLLPEGLPVPEGEDGIQVFVDWARAVATSQTDPMTHQVSVLVRSLASTDGEGFVRQPARLVQVEVSIGDDGEPRVTGAPAVEIADAPDRAPSSLETVPEELAAQLEADHGPVVGGVERADGTWQVVVMAVGPDGVRRPETIEP